MSNINGAFDTVDLQNELGHLYLITKNDDIIRCFQTIIESGLSVNFDHEIDTNNLILLALLRRLQNTSQNYENVQIISTLGFRTTYSEQSTKSSLLQNMFNIDLENSTNGIQIRTLVSEVNSCIVCF